MHPALAIKLPVHTQVVHLRYAAIRYFALFMVFILVGADAARADIEVPAQVNMSEIATGELLFTTAGPGQYTPALQLESRAEISVSGIVAVVEVTQRFRNTTRDWVEGIYVFPLPETAAVNAMELRIGERVIVGEIREKEQARREYQAAKRAGRKTALVEQRRSNMFSNAIANIAPGEVVEVRLTYVEKVRYDRGRFSLRFPMTITPRYIPGAPLPSDENTQSHAPGSGWSVNTDEVRDAADITPFVTPAATANGNRIRLHVTVAPGLPLAEITSAYHEIQVARQSDVYDVELAAGSVPMDRDFVLSWQPVVSQTPAAVMFTEDIDGETYALAMVLPPEQRADTGRLARELVFIIDTSGSMGGEPIRQARAALEDALSRLTPGDHFNIIAFNDRPTQLFPGSVRVDARTLAEARTFVRRLQAHGGTEMDAALRAAFADDTERRSGLLRQTVFITDGAVGNEAALFKTIADGLGDRRLFTVGIGSAPNSYFMRKAAQFGRGTFSFIGNATEVAGRMEELFTRIETPVLRNVSVTLPDPGAIVSPDPVPDLYAGQPIIVTAKLRRRGGSMIMSGVTTEGEWRRSLPFSGGRQHAGIATLWARDHITELEDRVVLQGESAGLRSRILDTALQHRLISRYTSFIAVEQRISRPPTLLAKTHDVPNLRPVGQAPQPYAFPQTATDAAEAFWLGLLGFIAIMLLWVRVMTAGEAPA
jgi:Ca-activated chloride channel family protein